MTIVSSANGAVMDRGPWRISPGQITVNSDATLIATMWQNVWPPFVQVLTRRPTARHWVAAEYTDLRFAQGGAIEISPDDTMMLVAWNDTVAKYATASLGSRSLSPAEATASFADDSGANKGRTVAAAIEFSADSRIAYVVASDGLVHILDTRTMTWRDHPIPYVVTSRQQTFRVPRTSSSISPGDKWLAINTADQHGGAINLVDLASRSSLLVDAPGARESWGLAFNHTGDAAGLLAVHGGARVSVFNIEDEKLVLDASITIPRHTISNTEYTHEAKWIRRGAIAWSGDGTRIIASIGSRREWRILEYSPGPNSSLRRITDFDSCLSDENLQAGIDVATIQKRSVAPSPTPIPSPTATESATPRPSSTVTSTSTAAVTSTATRAMTPTASPAAVYLPMSLKERCEPESHSADVAVVIDTSSSMRGQKVDDARNAALAFVSIIDLSPGQSQVAVVRYDREAELVRDLTNASALIAAAIRNLHVRSGTHIDKGLRTALVELQSERHLDRNKQVIVLLTDGIQTGTPGEELRAAAEVHAAGVHLYAIGLGSDVDEPTLRAVAKNEDRYYFAPDSADLRRIYSEIAFDLMCPGMWGGR